ncbi:hypothetical protein [Brevundimonas sp.]|uniref:hypothetical protein n=1 Tax=Brevundimonas sp. TaxID=1871086 RepID=UPI0019923577|nr:MULTISPECIES: hypothetical protein [Alphaproteobacteria]MBD3805266.1 hypothetical protein [Thioclava sp.]MBD3838026.1 hypothetical protein [Brevundimonas sp.]
MQSLSELKTEYDLRAPGITRAGASSSDLVDLLAMAIDLAEYRGDPGARRRMLDANRKIAAAILGLSRGDAVSDPITGLEGIVIGHSDTLERGVQILVQPQAKGGHVPRAVWLPLEQLVPGKTISGVAYETASLTIGAERLLRHVEDKTAAGKGGDA